MSLKIWQRNPNLATSCNAPAILHSRALNGVSLSYHLDLQFHTLYNKDTKTTKLFLHNSQTTVSNYVQTLHDPHVSLGGRLSHVPIGQMDESYCTASQNHTTTQLARSTLRLLDFRFQCAQVSIKSKAIRN